MPAAARDHRDDARGGRRNDSGEHEHAPWSTPQHGAPLQTSSPAPVRFQAADSGIVTPGAAHRERVLEGSPVLKRDRDNAASADGPLGSTPQLPRDPASCERDESRRRRAMAAPVTPAAALRSPMAVA
jgi:hypothetical protein